MSQQRVVWEIFLLTTHQTGSPYIFREYKTPLFSDLREGEIRDLDYTHSRSSIVCMVCLQCTVGLEGGSRRHSTVRQPDSQGSQTVFLVAPCCSDLTVVYANDVLVYGLTLTRPRFDEDW